MGAGAINGHQNHIGLDNAGSSVSESFDSSSQENTSIDTSGHQGSNIDHLRMKMSCEMCSSNFTLFKRKKFCKECHRYFCSNCLPKPPASATTGRQCRKCVLLISGHFTRNDLQNWKVKDIRCFLDVRKVSTKGCREKHDLVDLVLSHFCKDRRNSIELQAQHDMLVQEMAAHLTMDDDDDTEESATDPANQGSGETDSANNPNPTSSRETPLLQKNAVPSEHQTQSGGEAHATPTAAVHSDLRDFLHDHLREFLNAEAEKAKKTERDAAARAPPNRCLLDDLNSLEDIDSLSVRQLKELLVNNFVDYKGCCEKPELVQRVKSLWCDHQENKIKAERIHEADELASSSSPGDSSQRDIPLPSSTKLNPPSTSADTPPSTLDECPDTSAMPCPSKENKEEQMDSLCHVCMDSISNCIFLECGHMVTCTTCGKRLAECPVCRQYITRVVRVFKS